MLLNVVRGDTLTWPLLISENQHALTSLSVCLSLCIYLGYCRYDLNINSLSFPPLTCLSVCSSVLLSDCICHISAYITHLLYYYPPIWFQCLSFGLYYVSEWLFMILFPMSWGVCLSGKSNRNQQVFYDAWCLILSLFLSSLSTWALSSCREGKVTLVTANVSPRIIQKKKKEKKFDKFQSVGQYTVNLLTCSVFRYCQ